ncbi:MAG: VCBS repeat-containing protein [Parafilimonas sp.]
MKRIKYITPLFLVISFLTSCTKETGKFVSLPSSHTHITFNNNIPENDSINILNFPNVYNGGGVGVGDFNNDGLQDLYFTGNLVSNKLYLNKGKMQFEDVTATAQVDGVGVWSRGVAVIDINNDGKLDLYVCATAKAKPQDRINILYVNQGNNKDGVPVFKNMASEYGLADTTQSTMAYFFDYDNDGDLDLFIGVNHIIKDEYVNNWRKRSLNGENASTCKLYRNDWNEKLHHPYFTDVSKQAGILIEGYTHSVDIADFNNDGWQDMLVLNDYTTSNVLYINNHNGTFTDKSTEYFKHTAFNSMGSDAVDINNDGLPDVVEVDMMPQNNYRKKMFQSPSSYTAYQNMDKFNYQYQYPRNMLQLNMGAMMGENDSIQHPLFADIGFYSNIAETDWSWCPLVADFNHDGNKDIIFTNGFPRDATDRDFMAYRKEALRLTPDKEMLAQIPQLKIHNYAYANKGDLKFEDVSYKWGFGSPTFSNGAAYADLDNDGDLDIIINNINDAAGIYENRINDNNLSANHYLSVKLTGSEKNINAIGATVAFFQKHQQQTFENMPFRGYLSTQSMIVNAGFGKDEMIDSVVIVWADNKKLTLKNVKTNQTIIADYKNAIGYIKDTLQTFATNNWFTNITSASGINYVHQQRDYVDFYIQKLIPHKLTEYAPAIAVGDVNGDKKDDFIVGGSPGNSAQVFIQQHDGTFVQHALISNISLKESDDRGILLFDADNDKDLDLLIVSGGYSYPSGDSAYMDKLFINDGKGNFKEVLNALPFNTTSKLCVRACDYDKDGDLDLFISGRVEPNAYPKPVSSFIYRNDTKNGKIIFTDVTNTVAPSLENIGLVCDALFTDYDNDGWQDLILAGEWMPITFLHNENGVFKNATSSTNIQNHIGWWNSIVSGDFDNDGDMDYIVGNLGLNSFYRTSQQKPVSIYANDFNNDGNYDAIPSIFLPQSLNENSPVLEYPAYGRDDMISEMIGTKKKFESYKSFANATIDSILTPQQIKNSIKLSANDFSSCYLQNDGNGHFLVKPLPMQAQWSPINGMVAGDFDGDGNLDVAINTNDFSTAPAMGRYDAMNGLILRGNGKGSFVPLTMLQSGICIKGSGRALSKLKTADNNYFLLASQNKGPLEVFGNKHHEKIIDVLPDDVSVMILYNDRRKQKIEFNYGSSFLSQSGRFFELPDNVKSYTITNSKNISRKISIQ